MKLFGFIWLLFGLVLGSAYFKIREPHKITADELRHYYGMFTIPHEGMSFVQTYKSPDVVDGAIAAQYPGVRFRYTVGLAMGTKISFSGMHKLATDEIWNFVAGDPLESLLLYPDGSGEIIVMGSDVLAGQKLQFVAPKGTWMGGLTLVKDYGYSLMGNTLTPGFEYADYTPGYRDELQKKWPQFSKQIALRTREDSVAMSAPPAHSGPYTTVEPLVGVAGPKFNRNISMDLMTLQPGTTRQPVNAASDEVLLVSSGDASVKLNHTTNIVHAGGIFHIPANTEYRLDAAGTSELNAYLVAVPAMASQH